MSWISLSFVFILVWWLTWLVVLPMRVRGIYDGFESEQEKRVDSLLVRGAERGAPIDPMISWRLGVTTIIAGLIVLVFWVLMEIGFIEGVGGAFIDWVINFVSE